jgi:2-octaprenyl-6-methoxyphenol hydroxylase
MQSNDETHYDVVINGAGLAGMTLGLALHKGGLKVLLIEAQAFEDILDTNYDGRAAAIAYGCYRQWHALGLDQDLSPHACPMNEIVVTDGHLPGPASQKGSAFFMHFMSKDLKEDTPNALDTPLGYLIENRITRKVLHKACVERKIDIRVPQSVSETIETPTGVHITLDSGEKFVSKIIVSAEGRASSLRTKAKIEHIHWGYGQSGVVFTLKLEKPHNNIAYEHFLPSGPFAILPMTDNRACIVWSETHAKAKALMKMDDTRLKDHLLARFGSFLGNIDIISPRFIYPLGLGLAAEMTKGRLVLVGDAAHAIHPIAGQGLNMGLKDVAALSEVLIEAARIGEDIGAQQVLDRYSRWRRFDNVSTTLIMDGFVRLFSNSNPILRAARGIGLMGVNALSGLKKEILKDAGADSGALPKLLKGEWI